MSADRYAAIAEVVVRVMKRAIDPVQERLALLERGHGELLGAVTNVRELVEGKPFVQVHRRLGGGPLV